jgi:orotidine-5'-phosphate decarboxylase
MAQGASAILDNPTFAGAYPCDLQNNTMALTTNKDIPTAQRLIVALDTESVAQAKDLVTRLGDAVHFYKVGLTLIFDREFWNFFDFLHAEGKLAFADLKVLDVPATVKGGVKKLLQSSAADSLTFATVHASYKGLIDAAVQARNESGVDRLKILAVTVLTSLDDGDIRQMGYEKSAADLALSFASSALEAGCDGVISSGLEAPMLRGKLGHSFLIVVPGIRSAGGQGTDDQKRTVEVEEAFNNGADYIVVGRPIRGDKDPRAAAQAIQRRIADVFRQAQTP